MLQALAELPPGLRAQIMAYICNDIVMRVPLFQVTQPLLDLDQALSFWILAWLL